MLDESFIFHVLTLLMATLLGLVMGSFINCWAWRYLRGESVAHGRSHCTSCGHDLGPRDLVPVLSWLVSHGACRYCGAKVSARYPLTEVACAVTFALIAAVYGPSLETIELSAFSGVLLFLSLTDIDDYVIPNGCILVAGAIRALYLASAYALGQKGLGDVVFYVASALGMGLALVVVVLAADKVFGRESMGGGDLKLYCVAGFYFGWQQGLLLVIVSCVIGILASVFAPKPVNGAADEGILRRTIPFGPSIALACVIVMLAGTPLLTWYLGMLS